MREVRCTSAKTSHVWAAVLDDNEQESRKLAQLLASEDLGVDALTPAGNLEETVRLVLSAVAQHSEEEAVVVLFDYRLDDRGDVGFRGGTVASAFKEKEPTVPVVLLTTDEKLHRWVETRPGVQEVFDWRLLKSEINSERDSVRAKIIDLGRGWKLLREAADSGTDVWEILAESLGVDRADVATFEEVELDPPMPNVPGALALWMLHGPLKWPGPLLDEPDTRVLCGLTTADFQRPEVQGWLEAASYSGPFQAFGRRWWSAAVRDLVAGLSRPPPADATARASALGTALGIDLQAEGCSWCGQPRTMRACAVCRCAVDAAHSLRLLTDRPPAWADAPVVCFRCVADGSADGERLARGNEDVAQGLRDGSIGSPLVS